MTVLLRKKRAQHAMRNLYIENGINITINLRVKKILTLGIVVTGVLSRCNHSIFGGGLPFATQST